MFRGTSILSVRHKGKVVMAGDGQVTLETTVMKHRARKVRKLYNDKVLAGFAGTTADAFTLFERFEGKLEQYNGNILRSAVELAKDWRTDRLLRRLEALLIVADKDHSLIISGNGDVVEPDDGIGSKGLGASFQLGCQDHCRRSNANSFRDMYIHKQSDSNRRALKEKRTKMERPLTPKQIVAELDKYIIGQDEAKRSVAIALRNRWRRQQVPKELQDEIAPKNIIMIGPTGVGKTEISRRLAKLAQAPFLKIEASKFTEVGYVGRDVESMIRDLTELAVSMVRREEEEKIKDKAREMAEERVLDLLLPPSPKKAPSTLSLPAAAEDTEKQLEVDHAQKTRERLRSLLREGKLDERLVEIEVADRALPVVEIFSTAGMEEMDINLKDMLSGLFPKKTKKRKVKIPEALEILTEEEAQKLIDMDKVTKLAIQRVEQSGIIFLDELDKIASREPAHGPDVSREGVQRDILPIVEGTTVMTKYGMVRTDHILFIAAGAFYVSKPSDLIPELQGRFPIRVELEPLGKEEFIRILTEPQNALITQYVELMKTENVQLSFTKEAIEEIAQIAAQINERTEDIGARRLYTIMEKLLDEVSFNAPELSGQEIVIDAAYVRKKLEEFVKDEDLSRYIL